MQISLFRDLYLQTSWKSEKRFRPPRFHHSISRQRCEVQSYILEPNHSHPKTTCSWNLQHVERAAAWSVSITGVLQKANKRDSKFLMGSISQQVVCGMPGRRTWENSSAAIPPLSLERQALKSGLPWWCPVSDCSTPKREKPGQRFGNDDAALDRQGCILSPRHVTRLGHGGSEGVWEADGYDVVCSGSLWRNQKEG